MSAAGASASRRAPELVLAGVAIAALSITGLAFGRSLQIPWSGILPFLAIAAILLASSATIDLVRRRPDFAARQKRALRLWLPFGIVYLAYRAMRGVLPLVVNGSYERMLKAADARLFGEPPAWSLSAIHAPWLTELLSYAYATMFFLPLAVMLALYARDRDRELRRVALALQLAFYIGFTIFLLVPARSPDVVYQFPTELHGYGFYERSMAAWRGLQSVTYDAFPSMHTAISTIALVFALRYRIRPLAIGTIVVLLQFSTMYLRQHYFVDVATGWGVAALAVGCARCMLPTAPRRSNSETSKCAGSGSARCASPVPESTESPRIPTRPAPSCAAPSSSASS